MQKFKGTRGPWRVSEMRGDLIDIRHSDEGIGAISLNLAHVVARKSWLSEAEANAKLIAAAPELLEALQAMLNKAYKQNWNDQYPDEVDAAQSAIAKALGQ
ncbi:MULTISPECIES: hypothetical protein [unclassified Pantoea]|uniref:hypothetical protein n=1 Tax=unclassified Pantoea TaxID=2630326 RepID=UPI0012328536|nr:MULTISPECIES: hypothetical protein [unclassified Pantoea]KAA5932357.1 hypothetical protein F3I59_04835 [Pantoea sp. VH_8]KAA5937418.1 hypothetical protein F3I58_04865 [Pantoea sp. VH_4]